MAVKDAVKVSQTKPLAPDVVVAEALTVIDERGLEGFTMRALAERLGTFPNTVYWHVGNRDRVLAAVLDAVLAEMRVPDYTSPAWREWLTATAHEYRRVLHAHPNVAPLASSQIIISPPALQLVEAVLAVLHDAGFAGDRLSHAYNALVGSLVGWVSVELGTTPTGPDDWRGDFQTTLRTLDSRTHPTIVANRAALAGSTITLRWHGGHERPLDRSFDTALTMWLDGLAVTLHAPPAERRGRPRSV